MSRFSVATLSLAALALFPASARAERGRDREPDGVTVAVGGDVDLIIPITSALPELSAGGALRVGARVRVGPLFVQPEVLVGLQGLPSANSDGMLVRGMAGGRLGFRGLLQPHALVHFGYGASPERSGLTYDAGLGVDVHMAMLTVGLHATWNGLVAEEQPLEWVNVGPNLTLLF